MRRIDEAEEKFLNDYACSQAIFSTYCDKYGIDEQTALRVSMGFGGGLCMAETCGAVAGALMVIGLEYSDLNPETPEGRKAVKEAVINYLDRFKALNGSVICRQLLGVDISTPKGFEAAKQNNMFKSVCPKFIKDSATILEDMIKGLPLN